MTEETNGTGAVSNPAHCKYGSETKSCTSQPMDCQCLLDASVSNPGVSGLEVVAEVLYRYSDDLLCDKIIPALKQGTKLVTLAAAEAEIAKLNSDHLQSLTNRQLEIESLRAELEQAKASPISQAEGVESEIIERCAQAAEGVSPRHTECGNKIAAAIRKLAASPSSTEPDQT